MANSTSKRAQRDAIGWREWIVLPELGGVRVKAKIDTGARTSAIHAWNIVPVERNGQQMVVFDLHPEQRNAQKSVHCEARVIDKREIRNSGGQAEVRFVIETIAEMGEHRWKIELSLTRRDEMGFRMLLGRHGVRGRFLIDPGRSFLMGK